MRPNTWLYLHITIVSDIFISRIIVSLQFIQFESTDLQICKLIQIHGLSLGLGRLSQSSICTLEEMDMTASAPDKTLETSGARSLHPPANS